MHGQATVPRQRGIGLPFQQAYAQQCLLGRGDKAGAERVIGGEQGKELMGIGQRERRVRGRGLIHCMYYSGWVATEKSDG